MAGKSLLQRTYEKVDGIEKLLLIGIPEKNEPGVLERLRNVEAWIYMQKRAFWLLGGLIMTDIASNISRLLRGQ